MKDILNSLPERPSKPREEGLTMMMDKGLSIQEAENFIDSNGEYTDIIKLGFGTSIITPNITEKIKLYQDNKIMVYTGGTLFEAFAIRNQINDYKKYLNKIGIEIVEISDGSIKINHNKKCELIYDFSKDFKVLSEVGSKDSNKIIDEYQWKNEMEKELNAGSWKVIAEARESGNIGIFNNDGSVKSKLINNLVKEINMIDIIWEAPKKSQQIWFINQFGANVNLGNISNTDIIPLECLRLGLRSDTFNNYIK